MSTYDAYTIPVEPGTWDVPAAGATRFSWEYEDGRQRLLDLYQRGKDKQWDATKRIEWDLPVDPTNIMETPDEFVPIYGSRQWEILNEKERDELGHHLGAWLFSQFLHGEQGAMTVAARIVESVPDMDSKFYAATQTMDEARHVAFGRLALRDYYRELTAAERAEREEFVVEGCYLLRNRFRALEVWERMGYDVDECLEFTEHSPIQQAFRTLLFSRIVPCVKDIGLWGTKVQQAYADLGVLDAANTDLEALMADDERIAEEVDRRKYEAELAARRNEVHAAIAEGDD